MDSEKITRPEKLHIHALTGRESGNALAHIDLSRPGIYNVLVTPALAKILLDRNVGNRRLRRNHVLWIAEQMRCGDWKQNHPQSIIINDFGNLDDGQHRLNGVVESNVAIWMRMETGVSREYRKTYDTGIPKQLEDRITFSSDSYVNTQISQIVKTFDRLQYRNKKKSPNSVYEGIFRDHEQSILFAVGYMGRGHKSIGRASVACALAEMYERDPIGAREFGNAMIVADGDVQPARMLRDWCLRNSDTRGVATEGVFYDRAVFCMDKYLDGREVKSVCAGKWPEKADYPPDIFRAKRTAS